MAIQCGDDVVFRKLGDGGILLCTSTGAYFSVNEVGSALWSEIAAAPTTREALVGVIQDRFRDAPEEATDHIAAFVDALADLGLVTEGD